MRKEKRSGFTMIEIMLVVIIIGILGAMVMPNITGKSEQARKAAARADIEANLSASLDLYEMDNGRFPTTEQGLKGLLVKPTSSPEPANWNGPYLKKKKMPLDPWGREYVYVSPGARNEGEYDLSSLGRDGVESEDDIINWGETGMQGE
ncbi:MAG: type II secretion system major pseudopilin GspG [Candidatus Omnitrophica bacterium]|nr:type II secretion system major pseudopilin GspG [Candidatus Omnitrophota bacterium]